MPGKILVIRGGDDIPNEFDGIFHGADPGGAVNNGRRRHDLSDRFSKARDAEGCPRAPNRF